MVIISIIIKLSKFDKILTVSLRIVTGILKGTLTDI